MSAKQTSRQPCGKCGTYEVEIPAAANVLEVLNDASDAHRESHASDPVHIRRQIARMRTRSTTNPLTDSAAFRLGSDHDGSRTLCGAPAGTDMSWAEGRHPKNLAFVTCDDCKRIRAGGQK